VDEFDVFEKTFRAADISSQPGFEQQQEEVLATLEQAVAKMNAALEGSGIVARIGPWLGETGGEARQVVFERVSDHLEANAFRVKYDWGTGYPVRIRFAGREDDEVAEDRQELIAHLQTALQRAALVARQMM
jgi:hypothetical protein